MGWAGAGTARCFGWMGDDTSEILVSAIDTCVSMSKSFRIQVVPAHIKGVYTNPGFRLVHLDHLFFCFSLSFCCSLRLSEIKLAKKCNTLSSLL